MELRGGTVHAPFLATKWTGVAGDGVMDKTSIKGYSINLAIDSEGNFGSVSDGTILLDGFECSGPRVMQSPFTQQEVWDRLLDRGHWLSMNQSSLDVNLQANWTLQDALIDNEHLSR